MQQSEDIVWNTITASAKTRFNYKKFEEAFSDLGNDNIAENILFLAVSGFAVEHSIDDVATDINSKLALIGFGFGKGDLQQFLVNKETELKTEIRATKIAMQLFGQGFKVPGILVQVQSILKSS
ncbi:MAG TPA: hypothetical protein VIK53_02770 [Verrucomicrobiae bacterium]